LYTDHVRPRRKEAHWHSWCLGSPATTAFLSSSALSDRSLYKGSERGLQSCRCMTRLILPRSGTKHLGPLISSKRRKLQEGMSHVMRGGPAEVLQMLG
jgi:hypothetical protein